MILVSVWVLIDLLLLLVLRRRLIKQHDCGPVFDEKPRHPPANEAMMLLSVRLGASLPLVCIDRKQYPADTEPH